MGHGINRAGPCQGIMPGGRPGNNRRMLGELNSLHPQAGMRKTQGSNRQPPGGHKVVHNSPVPGAHKTLPSSSPAPGVRKGSASSNSNSSLLAGMLKAPLNNNPAPGVRKGLASSTGDPR